MIHAALYARVSSDRQAEAGTIESQVADLRARAGADGLAVPDERHFIDDGVSGTTLVRPALERLRDLAAVGGLDRLCVHAPDRLARRYAYQVRLVEALTGAGVEVVFLNRPLGTAPEAALLLRVQGSMAEYERATFLERSRRGKRPAARPQVRLPVAVGIPAAARRRTTWPSVRRSWPTQVKIWRTTWACSTTGSSPGSTPSRRPM